MKSFFFTLVSVPVFGLLYIFTAFSVLVLIVFSYLRLQRAVVCGMGIWAKACFVLMGKRLSIVGKENLGKGKNYVLIANHASLFDILAIMVFQPGVAWLGHERLTRIPVFKQLLLMINYIPVKKGAISNTKAIIEQSKQHKGLSVAIFPEGTRSLDGHMGKFFRGFIQVLRNTEMDLLPVTLKGFYQFKPKNRFYIHFGSRLEVTIHQPIKAEKLIEKSDKEIISDACRIIGSTYK
jgi:1-acyl-sn-glycerol-3-phosphate acyltransferase